MSEFAMTGTRVCEGVVKPEWIDINRHMNVAFYVLAFDLGIDALWDEFGIDDDYIGSGEGSTFGVECHVSYLRELNENDPYIVTAQLLGYDEKRIHQFQRMYHAEEGFLAATAEWMNLHVSLDTRRVSPWPDKIRRRIASFAETQTGQERPAEAGRQMSIKKPIYTL